jgi:DNA-directed RNA polymerase specialized sigma24 family protein
MDANPHSPLPAPSALLGDLRLEIEPLLARFQINQGEAEELLHEILLLLTYRWERIDSREIWLLAAIKRACLRRLGRRARLPGRS